MNYFFLCYGFSCSYFYKVKLPTHLRVISSSVYLLLERSMLDSPLVIFLLRYFLVCFHPLPFFVLSFLHLFILPLFIYVYVRLFLKFNSFVSNFGVVFFLSGLFNKRVFISPVIRNILNIIIIANHFLLKCGFIAYQSIPL